MNHYITFSGAAYDSTTSLIAERATKLGADRLLVYDDAWLMQQEFYHLPQNRWLWEHHGDQNNHKRGFGWFAWKPYVIMHTLEHYCGPSDIVLYTDADTYPIHDFSILYRECKRIGGIMLFAATGQPGPHWMKRDCVMVMGGREEDRFKPHGVARFMLFQKGRWEAWQFLMEWLTYCLNPLATTFDPSILGPEYPELREHRTEQSIMTMLAHKYGKKLYREACGFGGDCPDDKELYPQLFEQVYCPGDRNDLSGSRFRNV